MVRVPVKFDSVTRATAGLMKMCQALVSTHPLGGSDAVAAGEGLSRNKH